MKRHLLALSILVSGFSFAADIKNQESYLVKEGDTLWGVADYFLNDPWEWKTLWESNPQIKNPDLIYPNDLIHLKEKDGKVFFEVEKSVVKKAFNLNKNIVVEKSLNKSLPVVNMKKIVDFSEKYVIMDGELDSNTIVKLKNHSLISYKGDITYVDIKDALIGETYFTYKKTQKQLDDLSVYQKTGEIKILTKSGDVHEAQITKVTDRIAVGDIILKKPESSLYEGIKPSKPKNGLEGTIKTSLSKFNTLIEDDVVILDLGTSDGVEAGNMFSVQSEEQTVEHKGKSLKINGEKKGLVLVYKVTSDYSYAVIVENNEIIKNSDKIVSPF